jgi:DNA invertase Pin-like site-specific DNA recombinase
MPKLCAYFRVSTAAQGRSGLGLEGQEAAVLAYAKATGGAIVRTFREVESGTRSDRPELAKALAHTRRIGGTLVVAKLDRLSRNVAFLSALMESGAEFACCDNPNATRLTIHILAAVAEDAGRSWGRTGRGAGRSRRRPASGATGPPPWSSGPRPAATTPT